MKTRFHDAHERRMYLLAAEVARRIVETPSLIERGREHLERFTRPDPSQRRWYELWAATLRESPTEIARRILADDDRASELRGSMPVFVVIDRETREYLWR